MGIRKVGAMAWREGRSDGGLVVLRDCTTSPYDGAGVSERARAQCNGIRDGRNCRGELRERRALRGFIRDEAYRERAAEISVVSRDARRPPDGGREACCRTPSFEAPLDTRAGATLLVSWMTKIPAYRVELLDSG